MSSPPALDFPSSDADMNEEGEQGTTAANNPNNNPLFLAGTPSTNAGTPARPRGNQSVAGSSPLRNVTARRAVGLSTPKQRPLFAPRPRSRFQALLPQKRLEGA
ncbi:hypothetical protein GYMLUDRAFT_374166 [Collybiopsis luxurians FD-317 M1]|uniref:Uncharacterized protein n=1 Tax=Collybiopsis luxurians FD-317 M1 TaxID=944289 RepID=A0A0D0CB74_9AGAR|nr:hypothetical protein GYMLUDRAFT_374166 [Collybiopsis luxurians FD-317 M1]